jgi:RPA family protein
VSESGQSGAGRREVAYRLFAAEYDDADLSYSESNEDRAPNYVVTPTGARINRLFVVGVLTEVEAVSDDVLRARVVDPTGAFVLYAGQYQPDEQAFLDGAEVPTFVAVTGKARTFQPEDSERVFTSVRPESINEVTADTRDRWTVQTAEQTLVRVGHVATALSLDRQDDGVRDALVAEGVDKGLAAGVALALNHYETSPAYLEAVREMALDAARLVAGDVDAVEPVSVAPDAPGDVDIDALAGGGEAAEVSASGDGPTEDTPATEATPEDAGAPEPETKPAGGAEGGTGVSDRTAATRTGSEADTTVESTDVSGDESDGDVDASDSTDDDVGDFEPGEFDLDEEEREEIEAEYGTEFQSGTEVDEPGEADIETPEPDEAGESDVEAADEAGEEDVTAEDVDLEDATIEVMEELDESDGADRETLVDVVVDRYGTSPGDVEDAIQDALMDGRCYEPDDDTLKPI